MKVKVVVPRAGAGVLGGAEGLTILHGRRLAERGHEVEVVTTCASSHITWENDLPEGVDSLEGLAVRRFPVAERDGRFIPLEWRVREAELMALHEERFWLANKGYAPELVEYLADADYDVALLAPYGMATTVFGAEAAGHRAVIVPCLHDEGYARLRSVGRMLRAARGVLFNCLPEAEVTQRIWGELPRWAIGGYGFDPLPRADGAAFRAAHGLEGPLLAYCGRWEAGKGLPTLLRYVRAFRARGRDVTLVLTGGGPEGPRPGEPGMLPLGFVPEEEKQALMAAADVYVHPSPNESFSIVLMEAWLQGTPGLVWGQCAVTRHHAERSGAALWFSSYPEFEVTVERLLGAPELRAAMAGAGAAYVRDEFSSEAVTDRTEAALESWFS